MTHNLFHLVGGAGALPFLALAALAIRAAWRRSQKIRLQAALIVAALIVLSLSLGPLIDARADQRLSAHMVQHLLLSMVAAALLAAGAPVRLALGSLSHQSSQVLAQLLRSKVVRCLTNPIVSTGIFCLTLLVVHVPAVYDAALRHPAIHLLEHGALFWSAVLLWAVVFGAEPLAHVAGTIARVVSLIVAMATMAVIGATLASSSSIAYTEYLRDSTRAAALSDQQLAGGYMWIGGMVVVLPLLLITAWRAMVAEEHRARVREQAASRLEAAEGA